ncbi:ribonuclease R [Desulforhopalus singaporensis]|uniref:Ribonuclease R n=1 Tax=Desulforhopalus singaporensis TaxID=91360 RepID=A0A1H0NG45_9BACT|nr:ribonuclease R [Desulforhopalus singaporensis]SDO91556.1 RNAse R [Desulforhopalus singaporensis]
MSKKRKSSFRSKTVRHGKSAAASGRPAPPAELENILLGHIYSSPKPVSPADLAAKMAQAAPSKKGIIKALEHLVRINLVQKTGRNRFMLNRAAPLYAGTLTQHPKGFGFVEVMNSQDGPARPARDPFISRSRMGDAIHGDQVLIRVLRTKKDSRPEGTVIKILRRADDTLCGRLEKHGADVRVFPDDRRIPFIVTLDPENCRDVQSGSVVRVRYFRQDRARLILKGSLIEVLGRSDSPDTQRQLVIDKFELPHVFPGEIEVELKKITSGQDKLSQRTDLRDICHVTIDGETAKDFDDAVAVEKTVHGFRLYVSIADVSYFVSPGSEIDREAYLRGTSVYFPGSVIPMLPELLSNDLCSLVENQDRYTVSAILDFDQHGNLEKKEFTRSVIRSRRRFTYDIVKQIVIDGDPDARRQNIEFTDMLGLARQLAELLYTRRLKRGSLDFNLLEAEIILNEDDTVLDIHPAQRNFAHRMIEEFMLAANEAVAAFLRANMAAPLLRVHQPPDGEKVSEVIDFIKTLGINPREFVPEPSWFAAVIGEAKNTEHEYVVNNLLLRSLSQAHYSVEAIGHFALATQDYTHFTSPIRRYPDLIVHRQLLSLIEKRARGGDDSGYSARPVKESCVHLSARERVAIEAERDMDERLKVLFMRGQVGKNFSAVISGVQEHALYLEINRFCVSGIVPVDFLEDDYYIFDRKNFRLFGEITAKTYQLGDRVTATLVDVSTSSRQLSFKIIDRQQR